MSKHLTVDGLSSLYNGNLLGDVKSLLARNQESPKVLSLEQSDHDQPQYRLKLFCSRDMARAAKAVNPEALDPLRFFDYAHSECVNLADPQIHEADQPVRKSGESDPLIREDLTDLASEHLSFDERAFLNSSEAIVSPAIYLEALFSVLDGMFRTQLMFENLASQDRNLSPGSASYLENFNHNVSDFGRRLVSLLNDIIKQSNLDSNSLKEPIIARASQAGLKWAEAVGNNSDCSNWGASLKDQDTRAKWQDLLKDLHVAV